MAPLLEEVAGQGGVIVLSSGSVKQVKNWKMTPMGERKDVTHMGSGGWRYPRIVLKSSNGSFDVESYPGNLTGSIVNASFTNSSETGSKVYYGSILIGEIPTDVPFDDIVKWTVNFESVGPMTWPT